MDIRALTPADAGPYHEAMLRGSQESPVSFGVSHAELVAEPIESVADRLRQSADPANAVFGAFDDGALVGFVSVRQQSLAKMRHRGAIGRMYVAPAHRRHGLARRLLEAALACARAVPGLEQLSLVVDERNEGAIRLYRSVGFVPFGVEPRELKVDGEYHDSMLMWLRLAQ